MPSVDLIEQITEIKLVEDSDNIRFVAKYGITDLVDDPTPQLGGNLDVNGQSIVSVSDGDIAITPDGTGDVIIDGLKYPQSDGTDGQYLKTNGAGQLSWGTVSVSATMDGLTDTNITTTASNDALLWNGSAWVNDATPAFDGADITNLAAGNIATGTLADGRVAQSNVTQHEAAIDHDALTNFVADEHIDWTTTTNSATLYTSGEVQLATGSELHIDGATGNYTMRLVSNAFYFKVGGVDRWYLSNNGYFSSLNSGGGTLYYSGSGKTNATVRPRSGTRSGLGDDSTGGLYIISEDGGSQSPVIYCPHGSSKVNYIQVDKSATGVAPSITAVGSDTNINLLLKGKGTGKAGLGAGASAGTPGNFSADNVLTMVDEAGNTIYVPYMTSSW